MALMGMSILKEPMSMMHIILNNVEMYNKSPSVIKIIKSNQQQ